MSPPRALNVLQPKQLTTSPRRPRSAATPQLLVNPSHAARIERINRAEKKARSGTHCQYLDSA
jgi:hypothetical protein